MKRALLMLLAVTVLAGLSGCIMGSCQMAPENCASCTPDCDVCSDTGCPVYYEDSELYDPENPGLGGLLGWERSRPRQATAAPGPPTGAIAYPYYTSRGPRDFLARDPRSIGP